MSDVTAVRKRLVALSTGMYERSVPYIESSLPESGVPVPSHGRAVRDAAEGLIAGNVFPFVLAAVLRVAQESDHPAGPILAERMARMASEAMNSGLDWLEGANGDLGDEPEPVEQAPGQPAPRGFRVGDLVEITARDDEGERTPPGARLIGRTGYVSEIDDNPEYPIGLTVEGWLGPVWCKSNELRHLDRRCTACDGTGQRHETDPVDGEFESTDVCDGCDGTGHVAIEAESGAER